MSTENDPFIGKYKMTVFNVDQVGDIPAILTITKDKKMYYSDVNYKINDEGKILRYYINLFCRQLNAYC